MSRTPIHGLMKPTQTDFYDIDEFNSNMDAIDAELSKRLRVVSGSYVGTGVCGEDNPTILPLGIKGKLVSLEITRSGESYGYAIGRSSGYGPAGVLIDASAIRKDGYCRYIVFGNNYGFTARISEDDGIIKSVSLVSDNAAELMEYTRAAIQMNEMHAKYRYTATYMEG